MINEEKRRLIEKDNNAKFNSILINQTKDVQNKPIKNKKERIEKIDEKNDNLLLQILPPNNNNNKQKKSNLNNDKN